MFKSLLPLLEHFINPRKKNLSFSEFDVLTKQLKKEQPKPRKTFEDALKKRLHQRYAALHERREIESIGTFQPFGSWMRQWTLVPVALMLLVVIAGAGVYMTSPASTDFYLTFPSPIVSNSPLEVSKQPAFAPVMIAFDMPMLESSVEEAFEITPAIEGRFIWNEEGTTLYFLPKMAFAKDITYQLTLTEQAKNQYLKSLTARYERTFTTEWIAFTEPDTRHFISSAGFGPSAESAEAEISFSDDVLIPPKDKNNEEETPIEEGPRTHEQGQDPFAAFRTGDGPLTEQEFIQFEAALATMN